MTRRLAPAQPMLFDVPKQPRKRKPEPARIYSAVRTLRKRSYRVYRYGRDAHLVNGRVVSTEKLIAEASR